MALSPTEKLKLDQTLGKEVTAILGCKGALLFPNSSRSEWNLKDGDAIIVLTVDRANSSKNIRVYNYKNWSCLLQENIVPGFEYNQLAPYFHSFEAASSPLGFEFEDEKIAEELFTKVSSFILKESSLSSKNAEKRKSRFGNLKNFLRIKSDDSSSSSKWEVSAPSSVQHLSHIGFNAVSKKWDIENIPADWKAVFKAAGIRKRDLENEVAAHELMQTISEFTMKFQTDRRILPTPPNVPPPPPKIRKSIQVPSSIVQSSKAKDSEERYSNFQDPGTEKVSRSGPSIQDQIKQGVVLRQSNQITSLSLNADDQKSIGEALKCKMSIIRSRIAHLGPDTDDDNDDDW